MLRDGQLIQNRRGGYGVAQQARPDSRRASSPTPKATDSCGPTKAATISISRRPRCARCCTAIACSAASSASIGAAAARARSSKCSNGARRGWSAASSSENGVVLVAPDDRRLHQDIMIAPGKDRGARSGQIVVVEITDQPTAYRGPMGRILAVLGERLTPSLVVEMAIASHGLPNEWPAATLRDAADVEPEVHAGEIAGRVDLRDVPLVTIDGADARDFDDAVYAEPNANGFRLHRRDRRRLALRAARQRARRRSVQPRDVGVFPGLRRADAAGDAVERHLLAESERRAPVHGLRHADRPRRRGRALEVLRGGHALARAPDLRPRLAGDRREESPTRAKSSPTCCRS